MKEKSKTQQKNKQRRKRAKGNRNYSETVELNDFVVHLSFANIARTTASTSKFVY